MIRVCKLPYSGCNRIYSVLQAEFRCCLYDAKRNRLVQAEFRCCLYDAKRNRLVALIVILDNTPARISQSRINSKDYQLSFLFKVIRKIEVCGNLLYILEVFKTLDDLENLVGLLLVERDCCVGNLADIG